MSTLTDLKSLIESSNHIAILSHTAPDADAICSSLALKLTLENEYPDKQVDILIDVKAEVPPLYAPILNGTPIAEPHYTTYDLAIGVDCPHSNRFDGFESYFTSAKHTVNIDHHDTNTNFAEVNIIMPSASSTGELLFQIFKKLEYPITIDTAKSIFTCIITDTVCLTQSNISKLTYKILAELSTMPFDQEEIKDYFFKNNTKAKTFLLEKALSSIKFYEDDKIAIMTLKNRDLEKFDATKEDTLGIVEHANNIDGVVIAGIMIELEPKKFYVSLRSKGDINVAEIAKSFSGGGHNNMAAFQYEGDLKELNQTLVKTCIQTLQETREQEELER